MALDVSKLFLEPEQGQADQLNVLVFLVGIFQRLAVTGRNKICMHTWSVRFVAIPIICLYSICLSRIKQEDI